MENNILLYVITTHFTFIISKSLKFSYFRDIGAELLVVNNIIL